MQYKQEELLVKYAVAFVAIIAFILTAHSTFAAEAAKPRFVPDSATESLLVMRPAALSPKIDAVAGALRGPKAALAELSRRRKIATEDVRFYPPHCQYQEVGPTGTGLLVMMDCTGGTLPIDNRIPFHASAFFDEFTPLDALPRIGMTQPYVGFAEKEGPPDATFYPGVMETHAFIALNAVGVSAIEARVYIAPGVYYPVTAFVRVSPRVYLGGQCRNGDGTVSIRLYAFYMNVVPPENPRIVVSNTVLDPVSITREGEGSVFAWTVRVAETAYNELTKEAVGSGFPSLPIRVEGEVAAHGNGYFPPIERFPRCGSSQVAPTF